jgi:hypothetical protein
MANGLTALRVAKVKEPGRYTLTTMAYICKSVPMVARRGC